MRTVIRVLVGAFALIGVVAVIAGAAWFFRASSDPLIRRGGEIIPPRGHDQVGCTMEAKLCPDGSAVGRSGPKCEFAPCPEVPASDERISVSSPAAGASVKSPLTVRGKARGTWYSEGSFPISIVAEGGMPLGGGVATAQGEWMTEDFVPFTVTLEFTVPAGVTEGSLILMRDNPSGLPENDAKIMIPIKF